MNWYTICARRTAYDAPKCVKMSFFGNAVVYKQQAKVTANSVIKRFVQSQQNLAFYTRKNHNPINYTNAKLYVLAMEVI